MASLVLINGAPGSGKSTIAASLAAGRPMAYALDIDQIRHGVTGWELDLEASGQQARSMAVSLAREHLTAGSDVVIGQYLARTEYIELLESLADQIGAAFVECVLLLDAERLARRLTARAAQPTRPEHAVNNHLVGPQDAEALVASIDTMLANRPHANRVDASGTAAETAAVVRALAWGSRLAPRVRR